MSKMIILENVDAIVNSAGSVIAGDPKAINTHEADGHSTSASEHMAIGGNLTSGEAQKVNFSSQSVIAGWSATLNTKDYGSCASDGIDVITANGRRSGDNAKTDVIEKTSFATSSSVSSWGTMSYAADAMGTGASDGTNAMIAGGYTGVGNYQTAVQLKSFATDSTLVDGGSLVNQHCGYGAMASDGTHALFMTTYSASGGSSGQVKKSWSDASYEEVWASNLTGHWGGNAVSNKEVAVEAGGSGMGFNEKTYSKVAWADKSTAEDWGEMEIRRHAPSASSDGTNMIFACGGGGDGTRSDSEIKAFASGSTTAYGAMTHYGEGQMGGSGN